MQGKEIFFLPCLYVCREEEEDLHCYSKWYYLGFFFLTVDEMELFWTKRVVLFKGNGGKIMSKSKSVFNL